MKALLLLMLCATSLSVNSVQAEDSVNVTIFPFPVFSMELTMNEQNVDPETLGMPLIEATSTHLSTFIKMCLQSDIGNSMPDGHNSYKNMSIWASLNATEVQSNSTFAMTQVKADFEGEAYFSNADGTTKYVTQGAVDAMIVAAFNGDQYWELLALFYDDATLRQIDDVQIWVGSTHPTDLAPAPQDESGSSNQSANESSGLGPASIAAVTLVVALAVGASLSMFAYMQLRRSNEKSIYHQEEEEQSKESDSTSHSAALEGDLNRSTSSETVFSSDYWREAWQQRKSQIAPRPARVPKRKIVRQPSASIKPSLSAIMEEEEDWESASAADSIIHSLSVWLTPAKKVDPLGIRLEQNNTDDTDSSSPDSMGFDDDEHRDDSSMVDVRLSALDPPARGGVEPTRIAI